MTGRLLTAAGHGPEAGARLTPYTAQLWLTRFVLLKQTQQFELMEAEMAALDRLDNPDVYFEHAPHLYPGRKGLNDHSFFTLKQLRINSTVLDATTARRTAALLETLG